jgi:phage terminase small subunit
MARTGRKPKPTALHKIEGTFNTTRHRGRSDAAPVAESDVIDEAPEGLTEGQAEGWRYALRHAPKNVLRKIDRSALFIWVEAEDRHRRAVEAQARLDDRQPGSPFLIARRHASKKKPKPGEDPEPDRVELVVSPYLSVINNAATLMLRAASELGFTPASRPRLAESNPGVASPNDSPFKKLRIMQGGKA